MSFLSQDIYRSLQGEVTDVSPRGGRTSAISARDTRLHRRAVGLRSLRKKVFAHSHTASTCIDMIDLDAFRYNNQLSGAAEARRAHNPEDLGSKPSLAILFVFSLPSFH
jgi:hypothetical protein